MKKQEQDAKERIIDATIAIIDQVSDIEKITVRQIAEYARVGMGTINYHFQSKDNLLSFAIGKIMTQKIQTFLKPQKKIHLDPIENLKNMLKDVCAIAVENKELMHFMMTQVVINGDIETPLYLIPFLKDIYKNKKEEMELRIIALQILQPLQLVGISPANFQMYSGIDFLDTDARNQFIDILVNNVITK